MPPPINTDLLRDDTHTAVIGGTRPVRMAAVVRLDWKKGYADALQAIQLLREHDVACAYRVVGDGPRRPVVEHTIADLRLDHAVTLLGWETHEQLREVVRWSDVFLQASVSEGFGDAALEAQAMGVPVVATDADGLPEAVLDGETGLIVPRRNPEALAKGLMILAHNPELRQQFGERGRNRVRAEFQPEQLIRRLGTLYRDVLDGYGGCSPRP